MANFPLMESIPRLFGVVSGCLGMCLKLGISGIPLSKAEAVGITASGYSCATCVCVNASCGEAMNKNEDRIPAVTEAARFCFFCDETISLHL